VIRQHAASPCIGRRFIWQAGYGVEGDRRPIRFLDTDEYRQSSPVVAVRDSRQTDPAPSRRQGCPDDFPLVKSFVPKAQRTIAAIPWFSATHRPRRNVVDAAAGGFTPQQLADLEASSLR
jgi:hypothetical protein